MDAQDRVRVIERRKEGGVTPSILCSVCVCVCVVLVLNYSITWYTLLSTSIPLLFPFSPPIPLSPFRYGAPVTWQSAVFMWWAGLRGAVGLALGIQFYRSDTGSFHLQSDAAQVNNLLTPPNNLLTTYLTPINRTIYNLFTSPNLFTP